jgi:hypothetical protein
MRDRLRDSLYDVDDETWNAGEKDDILDMAVRRLSRRLPRPIDPEDASASITLATTDYYYAIDAGFQSVDGVFYVDSNSDDVGYMKSGWEVVGDIWAGTAKLHIAPKLVENGGTVRLLGSGRYTLPDRSASQATAILDDHVPLVLAWARAEAWRRLQSDRARFRQWQNQNQVQNISVNELIQMVADADRQADDEWMTLKRWNRPVPGYTY